MTTDLVSWLDPASLGQYLHSGFLTIACIITVELASVLLFIKYSLIFKQQMLIFSKF